jgi:hypothetical protein
MAKSYAIIWAIFFYPTLIGAGMKWMIPICLILALVIAYLSVRLTQGKIIRCAGFAFAAWIGLFPFLGVLADEMHRDWINTIRVDCCGVKIGMSKTEVDKLANSCGQATGNGEGYLLKPSGLAGLHMTFGVCGLTVKYDVRGNVSQVVGWCD